MTSLERALAVLLKAVFFVIILKNIAFITIVDDIRKKRIIMISRLKNKYIGDKAFYIMVLAMVVPMILQNLVTNFVSMLDNIMVGQLGTEQMNGVSIVNQYMFIFNISIFGAISGPGIFGAQFFGKGDYKGQKHTVHFRILLAFFLAAIFCLVYRFFDDNLISLYIAKDDEPAMVAATLGYGKKYMAVMLLSMLPFAIGQAYASAVRECCETRIPLYASLSAVFINLFLDYSLIFGKCGMPKLGVAGAAWATVVAKTIEASVIIIWAHTHLERNKYLMHFFRDLRIPGKLLRDMIVKGMPLLANEFLWVLGMSVIAQCYSVRGLDVVGARNISSVMNNLFNVAFIQLGVATAILLGNKLGAGKYKEAKDMDNKLLVFAVVVSLILGICMIPLAYLFPMMYNTTAYIRSLATYMIIILATAMPLFAFTNSTYFTLRSGGKTGITFMFDFLFTWVIQIPVAFVLCYKTSMNFKLLFAVVTYLEIIKVGIGIVLVKSNLWIQNIIEDGESK